MDSSRVPGDTPTTSFIHPVIQSAGVSPINYFWLLRCSNSENAIEQERIHAEESDHQ
jgi:hypothetical protein